MRRCKRPVNIENFCATLTTIGLEYGPTFVQVVQAWSGENECNAYIDTLDTAAAMPLNFEYPFVIHPATLDNCF